MLKDVVEDKEKLKKQWDAFIELSHLGSINHHGLDTTFNSVSP